MSIRNKIQTRHKIVFLMSLPCALVIAFVMHFGWMDYLEILKAYQIQENMKLFRELDSINSNIQLEERLSLIHLIHKTAPNEELIEARARTDNALATLQEALAKMDKDYKNEVILKDINKFIDKLAKIELQRKKIDEFNLSTAKTSAYYDELLREGSDINSYISYFLPLQKSDFFRLTRLIFFLTKQTELLNDEIQIFDTVTQEKKLSAPLYIAFLSLVDKLNLYTWLTLDTSLSEQKDILKALQKSLLTTEEYKLEQQVIQNPDQPLQSIEELQNILKSRIEALNDIKNSAIEQLHKQENDIIAETKESLVFISLSLVALILGSAFLIIKVNSLLQYLSRLIDRIRAEVEMLAASSAEISNSVTEASSGTSETASSAIETTATTEELKQTSQLSAEKARDVLSNTEDMSKILKNCETSLNTTIDDMKLIDGKVKTISESMLKLSEQGRAIGEIIDSVNDLAEQSNLLAVNAAIEAARAGDQGFAVVAQEIKNLAEQSKHATIQIRSILNDIQNATSAAVMSTEQGSKAVIKGVEQSAQTNESIRSLGKSFGKVANSANQIVISSQQQLEGVQQMMIGITSIKVATSQHNEQMRQIQDAVQKLNTIGKNLKQSIEVN